ncbi:integrase repeat-containing protein [Candidatus Methylopumilus universalis]|uniref:integrase repeat-containing protein n=1 Tax=Candidatus Methylopumilus universalis TaxID=2588536 RepID=UPI00111DAFEB|nr:integrase repeat-containing protein [Candidatus Methylopumilus universalis]QDC78995.1 hypothetical protein FIT84_03660 [Candidatus Methylopumilus universalis]
MVNKRTYRTFQEARAFVRTLNLKGKDDYIAWSRTSKRPDDIPSVPRNTYKDEWVSWGDWVGTFNTSTVGRTYLPFEEARAFVRTLNLKGKDDYIAWSRTSKRPDDIPSVPRNTYKDEWVSWGDWVGTFNTSTVGRTYLPFEEARAFVRTLNLKGKDDYIAWSRTSDRQIDIPASPPRTYSDEWVSWGDWVGTFNTSTVGRTYLPFEEARAFVRTLNLKGKDDYIAWSRTSDRQIDIPASPPRTYSDEWVSWGDWVGTFNTSTVGRTYLPFEEARAFVRTLNLKGKDDYIAWSRTSDRQIDIPASPPRTYSDEWVSWGDWVGFYSVWSRKALIGFIKSLYPILNTLEPSELYSILKNNNCLDAIDGLGEDSPLKKLINATLHGETNNLKEIFEEIKNIDASKEDEALEVSENEFLEEEIINEIIPTKEDVQELPHLSSTQVLENLDYIENILGISDSETAEFLINKGLGRIWNNILRSQNPIEEINILRNKKGAAFSEKLKERYFEQYDGAISIPVPKGYSFRLEGKLINPSLMQRLISYRLRKEKRIGNWSGTGAGKTLSAILASRVIKSKLTIVIGLNNTILNEDSGWAGDIRNAFPDSNIMIKEKKNLKFSDTKSNFLLLNYETFQLLDSRSVVEEILDKHKVDMIVLDEVHSAKSKDEKESKRRVLINHLLQKASEMNPDLCVLGMSATPVINSLDEAVSLIEMIRGEEFNELKTAPKLSNAFAIHQQLVIHGVRYIPNYSMELIKKTIEVVNNGIAEDLKNVGKHKITDMESILLKAKLKSIIEVTKPGTIIYSYYVEGMVPMLAKAVQEAGFKVGVFNGEDKTGLELFKQGKVDVLIGSSALGTGVNGLQYVCNRLIIACLPWTSAAYEQLLGRIYRQGSKFKEVEIFIPQIILDDNGTEWSWDKQRESRIQYKRTLADAAVDGAIPEANLVNPSMMLSEAKKTLDEWISRLESGKIYELKRKPLAVPLPPEERNKAIHKYGDFSLMNQRFNTSKSSTMHDRLIKDPEEFYLYHTLYREARETWTEIPYKIFAEQLNKRPDWIIGDFGCGEAELSKLIRNKVYSFDHVAINPSVIACDMANTGAIEETLDVAVFSMSLMGTNWQDYLKEAFRLLRNGGLLKIAEPASGWEENNYIELKKGITSAGFEFLGEPRLSSKFIYLDAAKPL